jgi:hypothetical protein
MRKLVFACLFGLGLVLTGLLVHPALAQTKEDVGYHERVDYQFPEIDGQHVLVGDFHMHTVHSDGVLTPEDRVLECYMAGYDVVAITDHGSVKAYDEGKALADSLGLVLVRGLESGIAGHEHYVVIGVDETYVPEDSHNWAATQEEAEESGRVFYQDKLKQIQATGGLCFYAHPHHGWRECTQWAYDQGVLVGVEVLNSATTEGWGSVMTHGRPLYPHGFEWALENGMTVMSISDLHGIHAETPPRGKTLVLVNDLTADAVVEAIRQQRTLAWIPDGGEVWPESGEMIWAAPDLLRAYAVDAVDVGHRTLALEGQDCLALRNKGAVTLEVAVSLDGAPQATLTLEQGKDYFVMHPKGASSLSLNWTNLWSSPTETLTVDYDLSARGDESVWVAVE